MWLFCWIYAVPLGLLCVVSIIAKTTGSSFSYQLGPEAIIALVIFFSPLIHLFVSTSRMIAIPRDEEIPGFPLQPVDGGTSP